MATRGLLFGCHVVAEAFLTLREFRVQVQGVASRLGFHGRAAGKLEDTSWSTSGGSIQSKSTNNTSKTPCRCFPRKLHLKYLMVRCKGPVIQALNASVHPKPSSNSHDRHSRVRRLVRCSRAIACASAPIWLIQEGQRAQKKKRTEPKKRTTSM